MKALIVLLFLIAIAVLMVRTPKKRLMQQKHYKEAFESVFSNISARPRYEQDYSYSYPRFTIVFASKEELEESVAGGLTEKFSQKIAELCKDWNKKYPFDPERAIDFTYEGELEKLVSKAQSGRDR